MSPKTANRVFDLVNSAAIALLLLFSLAPFLHIAAISLSSNAPILSGQVTLFPVEWNLEAYRRVVTDSLMLRSLAFTAALTVLYTCISMLMTICAAYPLTRTGLWGRRPLMLFIVFTMFFSGGLIPEYLLVKELHLLDSMWSLILPLLVSPFYLIIMISFFQSIPKGLEESAQIDGASPIVMLVRIVLPLSGPVLATLGLFYAVGRWNGFMDSLFYITNPKLYPLQLKLYQMIKNSMINDQLQMEGLNFVQVLPDSLKGASVIFATVPILIVYPWLQRYFISGTMLGAVKE